MKIWGIHLSALLVVVRVLAATTINQKDNAAFHALINNWNNVPPSWVGADPCASGWDGITCTKGRIVSMILPSFNLSGSLSPDIGELSELQIPDLSYNEGLTGTLPSTIENLAKLTNLSLVGCGFDGQIPSSIGSLQQLYSLSLNENNFSGKIPPSIGNLVNLYWLDLSDNQLSGNIPVSSGSTPGLDLLINAKHFHLGNNRLSGEIPPELFNSSMKLFHLILENNQLNGSIPSTLGLLTSLETIRLDGNFLTGPVPKNLNNLTSVQELYLSNNQLTGPLPNLTGMDLLNYVDLSNNSFDATDVPPWFSSLQSLTTLLMEKTGIQGSLPESLFSLFQLQTVILKNNNINGTLVIGSDHSSQLQLVDLQINSIDHFTAPAGFRPQIILIDNLVCRGGLAESYCSLPQPSNTSYSTSRENCTQPCSLDKILSPTCKCANPYTGSLIFWAPSFSDYRNATRFESLHKALMDTFQSYACPVDSVSLSNPLKNLKNSFSLDLQVFPSGLDYFNFSGISAVAFILSNQILNPPQEFGPYYFDGSPFLFFPGQSPGPKKSISVGVIVGAAIGGFVLVLLLLLSGVYAFRQKRRAEIATKKNDPFASWDQNALSGGVPQLKGAKSFSFEELKQYTNNFSEINDIGSGGYGKVYRGTLPNGNMIAIKRAQQGSMQGGLEFKTEIELLSRVHHKNVVSLVGFCFDKCEQLLVYEYIPNGTLKDSLSGRSGIRLDWARRLRIALGAAKGLQYLPDLANPPIIHRDIKSNNILLDERLNAKVADFGLSKPIGERQKSHVTTRVKGTMGYLDPEYYMTNQLTEKSDVYSFGVLLLEVLTGRAPIERGKYVVREVKTAMDNNRELYNLQGLLEPIVAASTAPRSVEKFVDLALRCVEETGVNRPHMSEVVKELENILIVAGLNPNAESASTSANYEAANRGLDHPYSNESLFAYSGGYLPSKLEPK